MKQPKICDVVKKGKSITAVIENGGVTITACCLATDSWDDYKFFLAEALKLAGSEARASNRCLRAALLCLFAHFEGVVHQISIERKIPGFDKRASLTNRVDRISAEVRRMGHTPVLNISLGKMLRDILAHPGIEKTFGSEKLTEVTIYESLSPDSLRSMGEAISNWIDVVCKILGVIRFTDTRVMVESLSAGLGCSDGAKEI